MPVHENVITRAKGFGRASGATAPPLPSARRNFFTPRSLAEYLSLSDRTVRELLRVGQIPSYKVAGSRRIHPDDVDSWLAARRFAGTAEA